MPVRAFSLAHAVTASTVAEYPTITNSSHRELKEKSLITLVMKFLPHVYGINYKREEFWDNNV